MYKMLLNVLLLIDNATIHNEASVKNPCAVTLPLKRQAAAAGGGCSATSNRYSVIDISDSEELEVLRNDGAPSSD
jgi:hypothetical protein